jgi:hypothetical protein
MSTDLLLINRPGQWTATAVADLKLEEALSPYFRVKRIEDTGCDYYKDDYGERWSNKVLKITDCDRVVVAAPVTAKWLENICKANPKVRFVLNNHTGPLLQNANGIKLLFEYVNLAKVYANLRLASISEDAASWFTALTGVTFLWLPDMYCLTEFPSPKEYVNWVDLRIGCFGTVCCQKNQFLALKVAIRLSQIVQKQLRFYVSDHRLGVGGEEVMSCVENACKSYGVELTKRKLDTRSQVLEAIGNLHLSIYPSHSEGFHLGTADGIEMGVPSVVSTAIKWAPAHWKVEASDLKIEEMAAVGYQLLRYPASALTEGRMALLDHNTRALKQWKELLNA